MLTQATETAETVGRGALPRSSGIPLRRAGPWDEASRNQLGRYDATRRTGPWALGQSCTGPALRFGNRRTRPGQQGLASPVTSVSGS